MPFRELQENWCVATDGDHTAGCRLRREPMFSQQLGALVKMDAILAIENHLSRAIWLHNFRCAGQGFQPAASSPATCATAFGGNDGRSLDGKSGLSARA
jgi:hypothetical protein